MREPESGVCRKDIGDHLGHRSADATTVYAKVDPPGAARGGPLRFGRPEMTLTEAITAYVTLERPMGLRFRDAHAILEAFQRQAGNIDLADVSLAVVTAFLQPRG